MKLKASALYMVIVMALVIAVFCSALIMVAYWFREQYQYKFMVDRIHDNVTSGLTILLHDTATYEGATQTVDLFGNGLDSVSISRGGWGVFDFGRVEAYKGRDTAFSVFTIANEIDSSKSGALYVSDEDRPISLSGKTIIVGNVFVPKAGLRTAYVDGKPYLGGEKLYSGKKFDSKRQLPGLNENVIKRLNEGFAGNSEYKELTAARSVFNSFRQPVLAFGFRKYAAVISDHKLSGHILLYSDSTLTIDSSTVLQHCVVFAKTIKVKNGFHGNCQLFARDSIVIGKKCRFDYPSCVGVLEEAGREEQKFTKITIGEKSVISGLIFTYKKEPKKNQAIIELDKDVEVNGYIYASGIFGAKSGCTINGGAFFDRFLYRKDMTIYENYLIDITLDEKALSRYYLSPGLMPFASPNRKKVLQWLERK